ncbi:YchJ family protein [Agaribacter marinus]|uniref:UPF0225 protein n=1 Tax=Agaribacter marinus TaxID=1431249 RepID=A0AA37SWR2_9ALTE|nr:YchJ family metal-binding protein [Agaribacter marinus]GLR70977.1 UPF0225 protein [Agaribacter marinus]
MLNNESQATGACPCGSGKTLERCCLPYIVSVSADNIRDIKTPATAEGLMRSRYTAYAIKAYDYIVQTYCSAEANKLSAAGIQQSDEGVEWLALDVVKSTTDTVEFKAWYRYKRDFYLMHERSSFLKENAQWRYASGTIHEDSGVVKLSRNDICLCGSGKKYKRCCL